VEHSARRTVVAQGPAFVAQPPVKYLPPVRAGQIAHALPRVSVVRRLEEFIKHRCVERVGNAYRVTDKVNIPDLQKKLQRRIDIVAKTAKRLAEVAASC
jgi:hypothetical protein